MAHGLGRPVADAKTRLTVKEAASIAYGFEPRIGLRTGKHQASLADSKFWFRANLLLSSLERKGPTGTGNLEERSNLPQGISNSRSMI